MFKWLTHRSFWVNLIAAIVLMIIIGVAFFYSLAPLTKHGETIKVPSLIGQNIQKVRQQLSSSSFQIAIEDSAYTDTLPPFAVVDQKPKGNSIVKTGRTVYLTVNKKQAPLTIMPDLKDFTFRSALMTLQNQKLKLGDTLYKPDIAKNAVLEQLYKNKPIKAGTKIPEGSHITLVLGNGLGNVANNVPDLVGLTYIQAVDLISASDLNLGVVLTRGEITDTANAYIFNQNPATHDQTGEINKIREGAFIDLWISQNNPNDSSALMVDSIP